MANVESATRDVSLKHSRNKLNLYTLQNTSCGKKQENTGGYAVNAQMIPISFLFNYGQIKPKKMKKNCSVSVSYCISALARCKHEEAVEGEFEKCKSRLFSRLKQSMFWQ